MELTSIAWASEPELLNTVLELNSRGYTHADIVYEIQKDYGWFTTTDRLRKALARARVSHQFLSDKVIPVRLPYYEKYAQYIRGDEVLEKNTTLLSEVMAKQRRKIFVLSDTHVPFTDEEKLQKAVDLNRTADIVVLAGDILDMYGSSRWRKEKDVPHAVELDMGIRLIEYLSETFPVVKIIRGNHDTRPVKTIRDHVPAELLYLFDSGGPLGLISKAFPNVFFEDNWYTRIGDAIFAHAEISSSIEGRAAVSTATWFKRWERTLGMPNIRLVVQAHTHRVNAVYQDDLKMIESGCMAKLMEYSVDASAKMKPPITGCVSVVQNDGVSDFNLSREYVL